VTLGDLLRFAFGAVSAHRLRSTLSLLGIAIGVGAVILLTSIGEGARHYGGGRSEEDAIRNAARRYRIEQAPEDAGST